MAAATPERADLALVRQGLAESRSRAQALILAGAVLRADTGARVEKPGMVLPLNAPLRLRASLPFVSRGGIKLAAALTARGLDVQGKICLDVGVSTGGFTDCLLQRGAARVYGVDVGYGQLDWRLRQDPRVVLHERCNIRHVPPGLLPEPCAVVVVDVSFISLLLVLPAILPFLDRPASLVALVKPQFEVGRGQVGRGGIVRETDLQARAVARVQAAAAALGMVELASLPSPICGAKGNQEFLLSGTWPCR